jgi:hypothetical protein
MNLSVSDDYIIVNIQGIRNVTWGETTVFGYRIEAGKHWFITITYKGSHNVFYYRTEAEVKAIFNTIREAMDKSLTRK